jgi:predicted RNA-binding protein associated with RNAse of E/G family
VALHGVKTVEHNKRVFDIMSFTTTDGKKHTLYFDITDYYGKL